MSELIVNTKPRSAFSEAIKTVRTNLLFSHMGKELKTVLVTSAKPGEGKSFISANLAVAFAQNEKEVLIIDCDLRRGRQHKIFNVKNDRRFGFSNLLIEPEPKLERYIKPTEIENVYLLPVGANPPNPSELLGMEKTKILLERLKRNFDIIILDCPPVLGLNDTLMMTKYSDANCIVVSANDTKTDELERVKKSFEKVDAKITGVILNNIEQQDNAYHDYYSSYSEE